MGEATRRVVPGRLPRLGLTLDAEGANVAVVSATSTSATLCLVDDRGRDQERIVLPEHDVGVWHAHVTGIEAGQHYGFRIDGPYDPTRGLRFDADKLLMDPCALAIAGEPDYTAAIYAHRADGSGPSGLDSAGHVPLSVAVDEAFDWEGDSRPLTRMADSVIYETHVKGFTATHPEVRPELRGTYAGLADPAAIAHLVDLGVTAVELLPIHHSLTEPSVHAHGLTNYWGYNTIGYFAPHAAYSAAVRAGRPGGQVAEFKAMVKALHAAGLEVILDVVFNHTAEAGADGPTLCFRGIDNVDYYRLDPSDPSQYIDTTGCGNALNADSIVVLRMVMDSLRYWVEQMHVDGFRFDLAATLGRESGVFQVTSSFFDIITQDPVLSGVKLIAEPWDVGQQDSYDVGRFPALWSEWNGDYRDTVRDFWRGAPGLIGRYASRVTGSSDLFGGGLRRPTASVNFVTAHDGFTMRDLVSYDHKHNEDNREDNRDGTDDNRSWNRGVEGPSDDPLVEAARCQAQRTMLTALLTSFGVPMLLGGDEMGRTQRGNNNAYCQDNEISWYDWSSLDTDLLDFTRRLITLRREHPVLRRRRYLYGAEVGEIAWLTPAGAPMTEEDWANADARAFALLLDGQDDPDVAVDGTPLVDADLLLLVNGWWEPLDFTLPAGSWELLVDSADPARVATSTAGTALDVAGRSMAVLGRVS